MQYLISRLVLCRLADDIEVLQPLLLASMQAEPRGGIIDQLGRATVHQRSSSDLSAAVAQVCCQISASVTPIVHVSMAYS